MTGSWNCTTCTSPNQAGASKCVACGAAAPSSTGAPDAMRADPSEAPPPASGGIQLHRIDCTGCGSAMDLASGLKGGQARCASCGSVIDLSDPAYKVLAKHVAGGHEPRSSIRVGMECSFHGVKYRVIGRIRYRQATWFWDEWFLVAADGSLRYLEEDGHHFRLLRPFTPKEPPPRDKLERGSMMRIDGQACMVLERGKAKLEHFEGQLPWRAKIDSEVSTCDLRRGKERISIEWTARELEFYRGLSFSASQVAHAFGKSTVFPRGLPKDDTETEYLNWDDDDDDAEDLIKFVKAHPVVSLVALVIILTTFSCTRGCSGQRHGSGSGYSGGHSSFGGGFGGK